MTVFVKGTCRAGPRKRCIRSAELVFGLENREIAPGFLTKGGHMTVFGQISSGGFGLQWLAVVAFDIFAIRALLAGDAARCPRDRRQPLQADVFFTIDADAEDAVIHPAERRSSVAQTCRFARQGSEC